MALGIGPVLGQLGGAGGSMEHIALNGENQWNMNVPFPAGEWLICIGAYRSSTSSTILGHMWIDGEKVGTFTQAGSIFTAHAVKLDAPGEVAFSRTVSSGNNNYDSSGVWTTGWALKVG